MLVAPKGSDLQFTYRASAAPLHTRLHALVRGLRSNRLDRITIPVFDSYTTDRSAVVVANPSKTLTEDAEVVSASIGGASQLKRGQFYGNLFFLTPGNLVVDLARGYQYDAHAPHLGENVEALDGRGYLAWVQEANDVAGNVTTTITLGVAGALRRVHAVVALYHCSGDVADRALDWQLKDLGSITKPTGFSIQANSWVSAAMTLSANQEGVYTIGNSNFVSRNDAGVLTYDDNTTVPNPFPLWVPEDDPVDLVFRAVLGEAADDYDLWVQYEEWLDI